MEKALDLYLMSYSKARIVEKVLINLDKAPKQVPNSVEAFKGHVMEFRTATDYRPGTLTEYYEVIHATRFNIHLDNGQVHVERDPNGNFIPAKAFRKIAI